MMLLTSRWSAHRGGHLKLKAFPAVRVEL